MPVAEMLARKPARRSSCPAARQSVYAEGAPQVDPALFDAGVPVFGICYGFQAMAQALGGDVADRRSEFGRTHHGRPPTAVGAARRTCPDELQRCG
jgi:GMP synthase (glutamine-hydrolysing)